MENLTASVEEAVTRAVERVDVERVRQEYWEQNECLFLERFLRPELVERHLVPEVDKLRPNVHRNYIPRHKKGGSVGYYTLAEKAPVFLTLYKSPAFIDFVSRLTGVHLLPCPDDDPHACALYFYTEPGDHMGFHYDNSYYKGARYTVLLGLIQRTEHCRLVCRLHKEDPARATKEIQIAYGPGSLVIFNGEKLYHAVTPLARGEERVVLTMEYVTNPEMTAFKRFVSNMKDAIAYFGFAALLRRPPAPSPLSPPPRGERGG
ncbi:MAG: 2OG-Fe(II) oxygenase [Candidatus Rokubacteria bacterium]|nr:2OG-Fe(II) oxygenase [Candidatus Rokubacteria bacterium]